MVEKFVDFSGCRGERKRQNGASSGFTRRIRLVSSRKPETPSALSAPGAREAHAPGRAGRAAADAYACGTARTRWGGGNFLRGRAIRARCGPYAKGRSPLPSRTRHPRWECLAPQRVRVIRDAYAWERWRPAGIQRHWAEGPAFLCVYAAFKGARSACVTGEIPRSDRT